MSGYREILVGQACETTWGSWGWDFLHIAWLRSWELCEVISPNMELYDPELLPSVSIVLLPMRL
jgi:hypothetical protein